MGEHEQVSHDGASTGTAARPDAVPEAASGAASGTASGAVGYPPERHFLKDLDVTTWQISAERLLSCAPLTDGVTNAAGAASLGQLAAMVDIAGAPVALIAGSPDWTATQNMSLHATGWLTRGPIVVDARLVRAGRNTVVVGVDVYDGHSVEDLGVLRDAVDAAAAVRGPGAGGPGAGGAGGAGAGGVGGSGGPSRAATGLLTFARIPRSASASAGTFDPAALVGHVRSMSPVEPVVDPLAERIGVEVLDGPGGVVQIAPRDYVRNSFGTINGGVLGALFQVAAEAARPDLVATDVEIHYLSQVQSGPARTRVEVARDAPDHSVVSLRCVDVGHDDRLLSLATVVLQSPPSSSPRGTKNT